MGAHGWVAGICQPWGQFFYLGAGWPQWKPLGIPGTHLPLKRGSWLIVVLTTCIVCLQGFLDKNRDLMRPDILSVLKNSDSRFVRDLLGRFLGPVYTGAGDPRYM